MKIQNVTNKASIHQTVDFLLRKPNETTVSIVLKPGEFVYSQVELLNSTIRIYERKGFLKISSDVKPENLNYYIVYNQHVDIGFVETEDKSIKIPKSKITSPVTDETTIPKKGRGRPVGTVKPKVEKPKGQKGRPKGSLNKKSALEKAEENAKKYINAGKTAEETIS